MENDQTAAPDSTAVRVALWRAMHVQIDSPPHVLEDELGLRLVAPDADWRKRPDMDPEATRGYRAGIVARAHFIEYLVTERANGGVAQYVILGAGLDTFAQRRPEIASRLRIFEVGVAYYGRSYEEGKKITWKDGIKAILTIIRFRFSD